MGASEGSEHRNTVEELTVLQVVAKRDIEAERAAAHLALLQKELEFREKELELRTSWHGKLLTLGVGILGGAIAAAATLTANDDRLQHFYPFLLLPLPILMSMIGMAVLMNGVQILDIETYEETFLFPRLRQISDQRAFRWRTFAAGKLKGKPRLPGQQPAHRIASALLHLIHVVPNLTIFFFIISLPRREGYELTDADTYFYIAGVGVFFYLLFVLAAWIFFWGEDWRGFHVPRRFSRPCFSSDWCLLW